MGKHSIVRQNRWKTHQQCQTLCNWLKCLRRSVRIGTFLFSIRVYEQADEMQSERPAGEEENNALSLMPNKQTLLLTLVATILVVVEGRK